LRHLRLHRADGQLGAQEDEPAVLVHAQPHVSDKLFQKLIPLADSGA